MKSWQVSRTLGGSLDHPHIGSTLELPTGVAYQPEPSGAERGTPTEDQIVGGFARRRSTPGSFFGGDRYRQPDRFINLLHDCSALDH